MGRNETRFLLESNFFNYIFSVNNFNFSFKTEQVERRHFFDPSTDYNRSQEKIPSHKRDIRSFRFIQRNKLLPLLFSSFISVHRSIKFKTSNAEQTLALEHFETNFRIESRNAVWGRIQSGSKASLSFILVKRFLLLSIPGFSQ